MTNNKRTLMTLFSGKNDLYSHQVRIVLCEKGVGFESEIVDENDPSENFLELNSNSLPTLLDRELALYESHIIMEYLDERFPFPPLMPVYPVIRARFRIIMHRIRTDWHPLLDRLEEAEDAEREEILNQLKEEILAFAPMFSQTDYCLGDDFSLIDCCMGAILWKLQYLGVVFTGAGSKYVKNYMARIFGRKSFELSLESNLPYNLLDDK